MSEKLIGLTGKKVGMTQVFDEEGNVVPVTVIELAENVVTAIRTQEKDGYDAVQVGNFETTEKHLSKAQIGNLKKNNLPLLRSLKEFRMYEAVDTNAIKVGEKIDAAKFFEDLKEVKLTSKSIGKGFQGGVKLHNHHVGRRSHGSKSKRQIGSIGAGTTPSRVYKGKTMPSMMGNRIVATVNVQVVKYDADKNVLLVKGPVSGKKGAVVRINAQGVKSWNAYNKATV